MNYQQALAFWYGRINYEQSVPQPNDLKLDRMLSLLHALGDPHQRLRIVHIAGSKGKGSTAAMLDCILQQAGYRTGMFTSPHLTRVEERFQVNGVPISREELTELLNDIYQLTSTSPPRTALLPTFFEIATAVGFMHFARRRVEVAVMEVGLGGRFDSTNVCKPLVSLITSISHDHTQQLGSRLASIAFEKAGIVKPGRPVVSGATEPEAAAVIERVCRERAAPLWQLGRNFSYRFQPGWASSTDMRRAKVQVASGMNNWPELELTLHGEHQAANAAVAIACVEQLRQQGLPIPDTAVGAGLGSVSWPARLEVLGQRPLVVLDCAHNVASMEALVATLQASAPSTRRLLVLGCANDKDLAGILRVLTPHFAHAFLTRFGSNPRSAAPEQLAHLLALVGKLPYTICPTPLEAWQAARAAADPDDLLCVTGSVFLAGELRPAIVAARDA